MAVLLHLGADPLLQNISGESSLHMAARAGSTTLMAHFIDVGIDVNAKANDGNTPLHLVAQSGDASCVRVLLDEGADINKISNDGWTPLRCAAVNNDAAALECLLDVGKGDLRQTLEGVGNLLHTAAYYGSPAVMQLLVNRGLHVASTIVSNGETVIHNAVQSGEGLSIKWLLANGASLDAEDNQGRNPQTFAVTEGARDQAVQSALEAIADSEGGANSMSVVWGGLSLLHLAAAKGFANCVQYLVTKGLGVNSKTTDGKQQTPLHFAAGNVNYNGTSVVRALAKSGAYVDARDSSGRTPLHLAAALDDHLEIVAVLLELGAACNIAEGVDGRTPLWFAANNENLACCSLLVARGADMALRDTHGRNALGASLTGPQGTLENREEVMKLLVDLGCPVGEAEIDAASRGGLTDSFAKAVTSRMSGDTAARELVKATSMAPSPAGASSSTEAVNVSDAEPTVSMVAVRVSTKPPPTYSRRRHQLASAERVVDSSKVYHVDTLQLRQAFAHLEGPDKVGKCLLLKLLLPPPVGWASVYQGSSSGRSNSLADVRVEHPGPTLSDAPLPSPGRRWVSGVELSCNGDDFDEAGFEAVLEYLATGQV